MPGRFRRRRETTAEPVPDGEPRRPLTGRRLAPTPGALRRERRALLRARDERIRDLGGLMLEMYRRDHYREELVFEQCAELVELEERILALDALVTGAVRWPIAPGQCACGTPIVPAAHFCANCGRPAGEPLVGCPQCGHPLAADAQFCPGCGTSALGFAGPGALEADAANGGLLNEFEPGSEGNPSPLDPWER
jgi:Double zinc ribbon